MPYAACSRSDQPAPSPSELVGIRRPLLRLNEQAQFHSGHPMRPSSQVAGMEPTVPREEAPVENEEAEPRSTPPEATTARCDTCWRPGCPGANTRQRTFADVQF
jgi:hypothetical protein